MTMLALWLALSPSMQGAPRGGRPAPSIEVAAPRDCGDAETLRLRLASLGVEGEGRVMAGIQDTGQPGDARWRMTVVVDTADGRIDRDARAPDCAPLLDTAAVIAAIALDPVAVARAPVMVPQPDDAPVEPPRPTGATAPLPVAPPSPARRGPLRARPWIGAGAVIGRGLLPRLDAGAEVSAAIAVTPTRARAELAGWILAPGLARLADRRDVGAQVGMAGVTARGCAVLGPPRVSLEACGGVALGGAFARAFGVARSTPGRALWIGLEAGPRVVWRPRPRLGLRVGVAGVMSARRPAFAITDRAAPISRLGAAAFRVTVGLETGWP